MKGEAVDGGKISKERGLCAAENGDIATVSAFLRQLLPRAESLDPEQTHEDRSIARSKRSSSTRALEATTAVFETAIENGQAGVIRELLSPLDLRDRLEAVMPPQWKQHLLVQSIHADHIDVVACLLDHGAKPNASTRDEDVSSNDVDHPNDDDDHLPLCVATALGSLEIAQLLVAKGADVNARCGTPDRCAPVFTAASRNEPEISSFLLQISDSVDADAVHPVTRETALHVAAKRGHVECVEVLLASKRASVNALNRVGSSALRLAQVQSGGSKSKSIVRMLEAAGACRQTPNKEAGT